MGLEKATIKSDKKIMPERRLAPIAALLCTLAPFAAAAGDIDAPSCSVTGAPPIETVAPVTERPSCTDGKVLSFDQSGVTRYACLNMPPKAAGPAKTPMVVYLHGSLTTPDSLYKSGRVLLELSRDYPLSTHAGEKGFILLSPEGRRAKPWGGEDAHTGTGFHWDEWQRDPAKNLDVQAIDHFIDEVVATGLVDEKQIYVFGWSNGADMAVLYGAWRADRIAAVGQYAGTDPWQRPPCPVEMPSGREVPLTLLRNMCDALAQCPATSSWSDTLERRDWPFRRVDLTLLGKNEGPSTQCVQSCGKARGLYEHVRWPQKEVLAGDLLDFFKAHALP